MTTDLLKEALGGDRRALSKLITLLERNDDFEGRLHLLKEIQNLPLKNPLIIGISGVPGAGKSTFIEHFGTFVLEQNKDAQLAVLTVDPASSTSKGSLLADKTRMTQLSANPRAFIRPSSNNAQTGGLHPATPLTLALLRRMPFTHIFIESVGVGQSEIDLKHLCDSFWVLLSPGLGDDLQALKKGILDEADVLIITKADVDEDLAEQTARLYEGRVVFLSGLDSPETAEAIQAFMQTLTPKPENFDQKITAFIEAHMLEEIKQSKAFKDDIQRALKAFKA